SVRGVMQHVKNDDWGAVDGYAGVVEINPDAAATAHYGERRTLFEEESRVLSEIGLEAAVTLDGRRIDLGGNIELPGDVDAVLAAGVDSIGLFSTELFYLTRLEPHTLVE